VEEFPGRLFDRDSGIEAVRRAVDALLLSGRELFLELGCGSGGHLIEQARRRPNAVFVGFELRFKRSVRTVEKAVRLGMDNLYLLRCEAQWAPLLLGAGTVSGIWVNFPDPWPKKRSWKHRMLSTEHLAGLIPLLLPGAFIELKSDHLDYLEWAKSNIVAQRELYIAGESRDLHRSGYAQSNVLTEFEKLFLSKGLPIYYLRAEICA
jgi:tRNA (guanine-N7-)-methyltransferase